MRVVVLTTSYPRFRGDWPGRFIGDQVGYLRERGLEVEVVKPGAYRDFGLAHRRGVVADLRRRPWALPLMLASMARAVRRAAREADLVHAHWLPAGAVAALAGKPYVVTLHGSDLALARRAPWLARLALRRARAVVCVSPSLAAEARLLGVRRVTVIPNGIDLPDVPGTEVEPPEVLYAGRLTSEKGVEDLAAAAAGLNLVVAGDGPLRALLPGALGFVPREELRRLYARAAVVVCPSRSEGFGVVCAEAMAYARPVVATAVGGLADLVADGETGVLVPPRDPAALRAAVVRLLADSTLRGRLGSAGRERIAVLCSWERVTDATLAVYDAAVR